MAKSTLRGSLTAIFVAITIHILLIFSYFNYISSKLEFAQKFVFPFACLIIVVIFIDKTRLSRFFMSAIMFILFLAALMFLSFYSDFLNQTFRVLYGMPLNVAYEDNRLFMLIMSLCASFVGLLISFIISFVNTARIKHLVNSLEVKK